MLGPTGIGKTHVALGLAFSGRKKGPSVGFVTVAALVHKLMMARDERRLRRSCPGADLDRFLCHLRAKRAATKDAMDRLTRERASFYPALPDEWKKGQCTASGNHGRTVGPPWAA